MNYFLLNFNAIFPGIVLRFFASVLRSDLVQKSSSSRNEYGLLVAPAIRKWLWHPRTHIHIRTLTHIHAHRSTTSVWHRTRRGDARMQQVNQRTFRMKLAPLATLSSSRHRQAAKASSTAQSASAQLVCGCVCVCRVGGQQHGWVCGCWAHVNALQFQHESTL